MSIYSLSYVAAGPQQLRSVGARDRNARPDVAIQCIEGKHDRMSALVAASAIADNLGKHLSVINPQPQLRRLFELAALTHLFDRLTIEEPHGLRPEQP